MLNKIVLHKIMMAVGLVWLTACSSPETEAPFPGEFIGADYLLSEQNAKQWAIASKQTEQCIYPTLTRIQQQHFLAQDAYLHAQYVLFYPLEKIIGEDYLKMIQADEKSMGYAKLQFKKFSQIDYKPLNNETCHKLRSQARDDLAVLKGEYKNGMATETANEKPQNSDGVATNDNKFFFDIIKWGAALLL